MPGGAAAIALLAVTSVCVCVQAQNLPLPPLPYDYDALEPAISEATLRVHHLGHHKSYTNKLNKALAALRADSEHKWLAKLGIDTLMHHVEEVPEKLRNAIKNNGGGYVNHELYFNSMRPASDNSPPAGALLAAIQESFGSVADLKASFVSAASTLFGSGYAWLTLTKDSSGKPTLHVLTTPNQDMPPAGHVALLNIDVWEHAYYLDTKNVRPDYIDSFWTLISWDVVSARYHSS